MRIAPEVTAFVGKIDFDPDALHRKYLSERDKRLREDGIDQYVEVKAEFSRYIDDPYVEPGFTRAPVFDEVQFAIVGGGFGGLLMGARLREAGFDDLRIIETGGDVGGTWYWNRYPGAMCDVESYCYLPLLEELGYMPKHKYSFAPEILEHSQRIARHYRLYDNALFQTSITELRWNEDDKRWTIRTNRGDAFKAQYVIIANGPLHRPKLPGIPGINEFKGYTFHTSRWDYRYTGGDSYGNLHRSEGQARRHHRHRRHRRAMHSAPRRGGKASLRVPAHALVDRRAQQRRDRPGLGGGARAGLAKAADGELQHPGLRRRSG